MSAAGAWRRGAASGLAGTVFGAGLAVSGMIDPGKVLAFLDVTGTAWDPSLLFVLGGAVGVTLIAFRWVLRWPGPMLGRRFHLPSLQGIDAPLVLGSAVFGVGWGLSGYCPGPAIASLLSSPGMGVASFVGAMLAGAGVARWQHALKGGPASAGWVGRHPLERRRALSTCPPLV